MDELNIYAFINMDLTSSIYKKVQLVKRKNNENLFWFAPFGGGATQPSQGDIILSKRYKILGGSNWWFEFDKEDFEQAVKNSIGE